MSSVISVSNQKGGVGKTTTTAALASALKKKGFKVLAIDLDPQGNLSFSLGGDNEMAATSYHLLNGQVNPLFAVQHLPACDLISSNILLTGVELEFTGQGREYLLRTALEALRPYYHYILIDTPPALSILTANAFTASDYIVVPMLSDIFSLQGIAQLHETVQSVRRYCNPQLAYAGILLTRFNSRTILAGEIVGTANKIAENLQIPIFNTRIRASIAVSEAPSVQRSLLDYAPASGAAQDYWALTEELLAKGV